MNNSDPIPTYQHFFNDRWQPSSSGKTIPVINPPEITDGNMTAPNLPGHGVQFDWSALQEFEKSN